MEVLVSQLVGGIWFLRAKIHAFLKPPHPKKFPSLSLGTVVGRDEIEWHPCLLNLNLIPGARDNPT